MSFSSAAGGTAMLAFSRTALTVLLNATWQVLLLYLLGSACAWLLRSSPKRQNIVWLTAFFLGILLPWVRPPGAKAGAKPAGVQAVFTPVRRDAPLSPESAAGKAILGSYLLTVLWAGTRYVQSWRKTRSILAASHSRALPDLIEIARQRCRGGREPRILWSGEQHGPLTVGVWWPSVVLPENLYESESEELLVSVLGHEAAHLQRNDFFWNALVESIYPLLAFHPCAALIRRRIRDTRELACDELVAAHLLDRSRYAAALLEIALRAAAGAPAVSLGTLGAGNLEERIRRLALQPRPESRHFAHEPGRQLLAVSVSSLLLLAACAAPFAYGFQVPDPRAYTGVWAENWGTRLSPGIEVNLKECCFSILEIRYENQGFTGSLTQDFIGVVNNKAVLGGRKSQPIEDTVLDSGVLRFRQTREQSQQFYELTPTDDGSVMLRAGTMIQNHPGWTRYARVR